MKTALVTYPRTLQNDAAWQHIEDLLFGLTMTNFDFLVLASEVFELHENFRGHETGAILNGIISSISTTFLKFCC